jgi:hypothetical protein
MGAGRSRVYSIKEGTGILMGWLCRRAEMSGFNEADAIRVPDRGRSFARRVGFVADRCERPADSASK